MNETDTMEIVTTKWLCGRCLPENAEILTIGHISLTGQIECDNCFSLFKRGGGCVPSDVVPAVAAQVEDANRTLSQLLDAFADGEIEITSVGGRVQVKVNGLVFNRSSLNFSIISDIYQKVRDKTNE